MTKPFPATTWSRYLRELELPKDVLQLNESHQQYIFVRALDDFYTGAISSDELASLGSYFWSGLGDERLGDFAEALYAASELHYYIRAVGESATSIGVLESFLDRVYIYYRENKHILRDKRADRAA